MIWRSRSRAITVSVRTLAKLTKLPSSGIAQVWGLNGRVLFIEDNVDMQIHISAPRQEFSVAGITIDNGKFKLDDQPFVLANVSFGEVGPMNLTFSRKPIE